MDTKVELIEVEHAKKSFLCKFPFLVSVYELEKVFDILKHKIFEAEEIIIPVEHVSFSLLYSLNNYAITKYQVFHTMLKFLKANLRLVILKVLPIEFVFFLFPCYWNRDLTRSNLVPSTITKEEVKKELDDLIASNYTLTECEFPYLFYSEEDTLDPILIEEYAALQNLGKRNMKFQRELIPFIKQQKSCDLLSLDQLVCLENFIENDLLDIIHFIGVAEKNKLKIKFQECFLKRLGLNESNTYFSYLPMEIQYAIISYLKLKDINFQLKL